MSMPPEAEPTNAISVLTAPAIRMAAPSGPTAAVNEIRPEQREDALDRERALDQRVDVDLACSRRIRLAAAVGRRPRLEDRELRREVVREHLEERLRHLEDLLGLERVEHDLDAALEAEDAGDVVDLAALVGRGRPSRFALPTPSSTLK